MNQDRIQVSIPQLYNPDLGELPWVGCVKGSIFGQGDTWGVHGAPAVGSKVVIELQGGDSHYPICTGSIKRKAADGFVSGTNWGFVDTKGNTLNVNLETGKIEFKAAAGVDFVIGADGSLKVTSALDATLTMPNVHLNSNLKVAGNFDCTGTMHNNGINVGSTHVHQVVSIGAPTLTPSP